MEENQVSLGALAAAYYRAYHAIHDDPKIFYDHLANRLITEEESVFLEQLFRQLFESIDPASAASCSDQALFWRSRCKPYRSHPSLSAVINMRKTALRWLSSRGYNST